MASSIALVGLLLLSAVSLAQSDPVAIPHGGPVAITHVTVIDATGAAPRPETTVVVRGERIEALGRTGELAVPLKWSAVAPIHARMRR